MKANCTVERNKIMSVLQRFHENIVKITDRE